MSGDNKSATDYDQRINVLYIGGEGRSGSTLLAELLGHCAEVCPVGELRSVWHALSTDELCGCGVPFSSCRFWSRVGYEAFGGWHRVNLGRIQVLDENYARHRFVLRLIVPWLRRRHSEPLSEYVAILGRLYAAVKKVSGCSLIVDGTKDPAYALLLHATPVVNLRVVHLVRDSRAVAYSWARRVERPEYANHPALRGTFMDQRAPWKAALWWDVKNVLLHWLEYMGVERLLLRYESLVMDPVENLRRVLMFADQDGLVAASAVVSAGSAWNYESLPHHTIGGNRLRFARGPVAVRPDDEWRAKMDRRLELLVCLLTLPLLRLYGYALRRSGPPAA